MAAAQAWRVRERTEHEASALFRRLAADLQAAAAPVELSALATRAAEDERRHAVHCRRIIDALVPGLAPLPPDLTMHLGPTSSAAADRALYASVALGCVTESLSTALLIELRPRAEAGVVREALDVILEDEVRHSRLGWAYLAHEASRRDVAFLAPAVPAMLHAALEAESASMGPALGDDEKDGRRGWGILPTSEGGHHPQPTLAHGIQHIVLGQRLPDEPERAQSAGLKCGRCAPVG